MSLAQGPILPRFDNAQQALERRQATDAQQARLRASNIQADDKKIAEEREAERQRIKGLKQITGDRFAQRMNCFGYRQTNEQPSEQSLSAKLSRLNDLNPEALLGEYLATVLLHMFAFLFMAEYFRQQRSYSDALELDAAKEARFLEGLQNGKPYKDDGIRVAYQPIREYNEATGEFEMKLDALGNPVWPDVYPVDGAGNVDYSQTPNTNGEASRFAIRANGFVPVENLQEALKAHALKFERDVAGAGGFSPEELMIINKYMNNANSQKTNRDAEDAKIAQRIASTPRK